MQLILFEILECLSIVINVLLTYESKGNYSKINFGGRAFINLFTAAFFFVVFYAYSTDVNNTQGKPISYML